MITLHDGEEVVLEVRRHWIVIAPFIAGLFVAAFGPLVVYALIDALPISFETPGWGPGLIGFAYAAWLLLLWVIGYLVWLDHHLDLWIVTNERLIDVEQKGIFRREVSSLRLERVQDITAEVDGVIATFLKFGDLKVQNAGDTPEFTITNIADPQRVVDAINSELARRGRMGRIDA